MGRKGSLFVLAILALLVVLLVEACAGGAPVAAPGAASAKPTTIRLMQSGEVKDFNFMERLDIVGEAVPHNVMEPLVNVGKKGETVPKLATKWEQVNPTTWRMSLRKGVKFHNGADFTASDVVETVKWFIDAKETSVLYDRLPVNEAVAVDNYTVDVRFKTPQPQFLINARLLMIYPAAVARDKRDEAKVSPVGTGPYRFVRWDRGQKIELARFDGYWGPKPSIDKAEIVWRAEPGVRLAALNAGEADWVYGLSAEDAKLAPKVVSVPSSENYYLRLDESVQKDPILADKRLRLALDYGINRDTLVALFAGGAPVLQGQLGKPGDFGFDPNAKNRPYDLEKAKALVKEANAVGKSVNFIGLSGQWPKDREMAEAIAQMIEQTGLKVKLNLVPPAESVKYNVTTGEFRQFTPDIMLTSGDTLLEIESRYAKFLYNKGTHYAANDPETSRRFEEVLAELDPAKRAAKLASAWAYAYQEAHFIPLVKPPYVWGVAKNLEWEPDIITRPFLADFRFTN